MAAAFLLPPPFNGLIGILSIIGAVALPFAVPLLLGLDFYRSSYSKTGYLTHTLPVRGATIFWVKFAYASVVGLLFLALAAGLGYLAAMTVAHTTGMSPTAFADTIAQGVAFVLDYSPWWLTTITALVVLLWPGATLAQHYFAATVGSEGWINRLGFGGVVVVWFLYYVATQVVGLVALLLPMNLVLSDGGLSLSLNPMVVFQSEGLDGVIPLGAILNCRMSRTAIAIVWAKVSFEKKLELR